MLLSIDSQMLLVGLRAPETVRIATLSCVSMVWYGMIWYGMVWYGIFIFQRQYKVIRKQK